MILGQRIRLAPNNVQATFFERCADTARFTFNWGLARWQAQYATGDAKQPSWMGLDKEFNSIKTVSFPWIRDIPWDVTNRAFSDLGRAFQNFFRRVKIKAGKPGYPRFKSKKRTRPAFGLDARCIKFDGKKVKIPKLGWVRIRQELRFPGKLLSTARITKRAGHWYLSIQIEIDSSWIYPHRCETQAAVGIDLGLRDLAVLSDGTRVKAPRTLRAHEKQLRRLNKELSRRTKGGKNRAKTKAKLARLHERIANVRKDTTNNLTARIVRDFRVIGIEDLNVTGMVKNHRLAKSIMDASISEVARQLAYKASLAGSTVVKADRWFPSSRVCSACGLIRGPMSLSTRRWTCECGAEHDRDENSAKNLRTVALTGIACCQGSSGREPNPAKLPLGQEEGSHCVNL